MEISGSGFASNYSTRQGDNRKCGSQVVVNLFFDGTKTIKKATRKPSHTSGHAVALPARGKNIQKRLQAVVFTYDLS